ncbi:demethylmenaquinone methyltransferase-like [Ptychodera flava]|uniref:demethylmenaquinone methyltransferase-like n=1 Tax=Ptychodera flava TaxID=63121 RepID=UPI00396A73DB
MNIDEAESYSSYRLRFVRKSAEDVVKRLSFSESDALLDVCCGSGELTKLIADKVNLKSVTGFDINPNMIEIARTQNSAPNITYLTGNAGDPSAFKQEWENSYDKALSYFGLNWIKNWPMTVRCIFNCLKSGGECFLNIEVDERPHFFSVINDAVDELPEYKGYLQGFVYEHYPLQGTLNDFANTISTAGFVDVKCELDTVLPFYVFDNDIQSKTFVKGFLPQAQRIPEEMREEFIEEVFQRAKAKCEKTEDGKPKWRHTIFTATARKP